MKNRKNRIYILCSVLWAGLSIGVARAQSFVSVVAADGSGQYTSVQAAVDACPSGTGRHVIFIKNGTYAERVNLPKGKTLSLVGESRDGVVITNDRNRGKTSPYRNFRDITTLQCQGDDFYMENITVANTAGNVGQAEAHFIAGARQVYRDCRFTGYQDTQRTKNGAYAYLADCVVEGAVDFIYGDGLMFYDRCTLHCVSGHGYVTAPSEWAHTTVPASDGKPLHYGYIFRQCRLTADPDVAEGSYYLGRPWGERAASYFIGCTMGTHINALGWHEWDGREATADFAEWGTRDAEGRLADVSRRASWSRQLPEADAVALTPATVFATQPGGADFRPEAVCHMEAPVRVRVDGGELTWTAVPGAVGYLVYADGRFLAAVEGTVHPVEPGHAYAVKAVSALGVTSHATQAPTPERK